LSSIRTKLLWGVGVPALAVALTGIGLSWHRAHRAVEDATRQEALTLSELVAGNFSLASGPFGSAEVAHRGVSDAFRSDSRLLQDVGVMRVLDRDGKVRWSRRVEEVGQRWPDAQRLLAAPAGSRVTVHSGATEVVRPLGGVECAGCHAAHALDLGVLQLTLEGPKLQQDVGEVFTRALWSLLALALVLLGATATAMHLVLTQPLRRLAAMMRRAEDGDFLVRAPVRGNDELSQLSVAFNRMLERLTSMKASEIDTQRDLAHVQEQLALKQALEKTNADLNWRLTELSLLYDVSRTVNTTLQLPELFGRVTTLVTERMRVPRFSIMMLDDGGALEIKYAHPRGIEGIRFEKGEGLCARAAESKQTVYTPDISADGGFVPKSNIQRDGSLLAVPMVVKDALLGVVNFERPEKAAFAPDEIELFTTVTDQLAMAIQNADLYEETLALSITDALTGLPNRRHLFSRLEMEIARAHRFGTGVSFLMIDIDHFKKLNDSAGHRAGDITLRQVSDLMRVMVRKVDTLGRYGGEEFALVLPQVSKAEAFEVAEKLRGAVEHFAFTHGSTQPGGRVTISVGVATLPGDGTTIEKLVDCADAALYASKRGGRNKVSAFEPGMEDHPGRERGPQASSKRTRSGEMAQVKTG
jgi:diguanylate cyclase (GGDEF)-like protein